MIKLDKNLILIYTISFASFMVNLDTYVVNVALPSITKSFEITTAESSWIVSGYNLMIVSFLLIFGKLADTVGLKRMFTVGFCIFGVSSLLCGISNSILMLVLSRILQGLGGAILYALPQAMIVKFLPMKKHSMAFGILAATAALGITLGAPLSGFISEMFSWRWVFFINLPIAFLSIYFLNYSVSENIFKNQNNCRFDLFGAFLSFLFALSFTFYLNKVNTFGWDSKKMLLLLGFSIVIFIGFILREVKSSSPLINLKIFKNWEFNYANGSMFLVSAYLAAINFLIPFYLIRIEKFSSFEMGLTLMIYSIFYMVTSLISSKFTQKFSLNSLCEVATFLATVNLSLFIISIGNYHFYLYPFFAINGIALSIFITSNNSFIMSLAKSGEEGVFAGIHRLTGRFGMLFGVVFFEAIFSANLNFGELSAFKNTFLFLISIFIIILLFSIISKLRFKITHNAKHQ